MPYGMFVVEPLKKSLYNKMVNRKYTALTLRFSGGHDEGMLDIDLTPCPPYPHSRKLNPETNKYETVTNPLTQEAWDKHAAFLGELEDWVWSVYNYNGAGEGVQYGDTVEYDLVTGIVYTIDWGYTYQETVSPNTRIQFVKEGNE